MFKEILVLCCAVIVVRCQESQGVRPVDCAFTVWSEWRDIGNGRELRTRSILRSAQFGGRECQGAFQQTRSKQAVQLPSVSKFLTKFIPGNRESLPLGGHLLRGETPKTYTKSRDLAVVIDTTIFPSAMPLYKSAVANLVGAICGDIGNGPEDNIVSLIVYDHNSANVIHAFNAVQSKAAIQNKILGITSTGGQQLSLVGEAMDLAKHEINTYGTGTRPINLANKDVLLFMTYRTICSRQEIRKATALKAAGRVYVIVLGEPADQSSPPSNWCLHQYASDEFDFHFLRLATFGEIRDLSLWVTELTTPGNPCVTTNVPPTEV